MSRFNKIFAGPVTAVLPQVVELLANEDILPGKLIVADAAGDGFDIADNASTGRIFVAQENYLAMEGVDTAIASGNTVVGLEMIEGMLFHARLAIAGNVTIGDPLAIDANGDLVAAGAAAIVVATADENFNNTTGATALIRVRPTRYVTAA